MNIISSYGVKIKADTYRPINQTVEVTTKAVRFFVDAFYKEWDYMNTVLDNVTSNEAMGFMESLTHKTKNRPIVKYDFDSKFYKMPSGIRRYCINKAFGMVSSYKTNLDNWNMKQKGKRPSFPKVKREMPVFYKSEYNEVSDYCLKLKVYNGSDWVWLQVKLKKSDADYLKHHFADNKASSPVLEKRYKNYYLRYAFEEKVSLNKTPIKQQKILAVDLGINNAATCSVMLADGTVLARKFCKLTREKDRLKHELNKIKQSQQHGSVKMPRKWAKAKGLNRDIAVKTASFIMETAISYDVDTIVFEHLDLQHKKRGSKKQKLHMWRANDVQIIVTHKAHRNGIRVSHVNPWGTSRLAYDGTGKVERGFYTVNGVRKYNYSICIFSSGKQYHCDLNASYNIGARYFIRELLKSLNENLRLQVLTKISELATRSRCVLASLIKLNAVLNDCLDYC